MKRIIILVIIVIGTMISCNTCNESSCDEWGKYRGPLTDLQQNQMMKDCDCDFSF